MENQLNSIVIVDDEEIVLSSIRSFLDLETDYDVTTFPNADQALNFITDNPVDLVISDYLMPNMNGIEFLSHVRKINPNIPRIILTGYADKESAIKAINEIGLFKYIEKPWDNDNLLSIIQSGLALKKVN